MLRVCKPKQELFKYTDYLQGKKDKNKNSDIIQVMQIPITSHSQCKYWSMVKGLFAKPHFFLMASIQNIIKIAGK